MTAIPPEGTLIAPGEAEALILRQARPVRRETVPLSQALGRYLAQPLHAERDHPPFDRVTHDGIALSAQVVKEGGIFKVARYAAAGQPQAMLTVRMQCIEVATGAPLPQGCDTVIPYEMLTRHSQGFRVNNAPAAGQCIHRQGADAAKGRELLAAGTRIGTHELAALASNGMAQVPVFARPTIALLATGDELVEADAPVAAHQIRRSNDVALAAALRENGFPDVQAAWAVDEPAALESALRGVLGRDVLLVTGGVSRGALDRVPGILRRLEVKEIFHRVAQRPGKPLWFGVGPGGQLVFGLPGNPASCLTCLVRYVLPLLRGMTGAPVINRTVTLNAPARTEAALTLFVPVRVEDGKATILATQGSGDFLALLGSDGLAELPPRGAAHEAGEAVRYYPWAAL